jgi:hypothetical protein
LKGWKLYIKKWRKREGDQRGAYEREEKREREKRET